MNRWQQTRIRRYRSKVDRLVDAGEHSRALTAIIDFAQWADGNIEDTDIWLEMTVSATRIVAHLEDPAEYRAFLAHFAAPFLGEDSRPRVELLDAFASIASDVEPSVMGSIGTWLTDARPDWPLGPYLYAHFAEVALRQADTAPTPLRIADHFEMAARRAHRIDDAAWRLHNRLRLGSILLTTGADRRRGRQILGELDWSQLTGGEQLWMVVSLAASSRWTDRMRAMDILLDLHQSISSARPDAARLATRDLRHAASTVVKLAGLDLPEAEQRRLEELSETLFSGDERDRWKNFLVSRGQLSKVAALPFDQTDEVLGLLEKLGAVYPDRWEPATRRFRILRAGYNGDYHSSKSVPTPQRHDRRLPVADTVAQILDQLAGGEADDDASLPSLFDELIEVLDGFQTGGDTAAARPVALVWDRLLDDDTDIDLENFEEQLTELARHHTTIAPPPSYGWWTLAAHLFDHELHRAANVVAEAARVAEQPDADDQIRDYVASHAFHCAVDRTDTAATQRWLNELPQQ